jgi:glycosyltransferase involved in cell wall biosynthesis
MKKCKDIFIRKDVEVIFVNNGSVDNSGELLKTNLSRISNVKIVTLKVNKGYGYGIKRGVEQASGDVIGWTHADNQTNVLDFLYAINLFNDTNSNFFVKGLRNKRTPADNFFTFGMSLFETILFRKFFWDINAQPTLMKKKFYKSLKNIPNDFSIDLFFYYHAIKNNLPIKRFPVDFHPRLFGTSSWNFGFLSRLKFSFRTIKYSFRLLYDL